MTQPVNPRVPVVQWKIRTVRNDCVDRETVQNTTQILGKNIVAPNVEPNMRHPHSANQKKLSAAANKEACHFQVSEAKLRMQDLAGKKT